MRMPRAVVAAVSTKMRGQRRGREWKSALLLDMDFEIN
jgi:hypothetical protein